MTTDADAPRPLSAFQEDYRAWVPLAQEAAPEWRLWAWHYANGRKESSAAIPVTLRPAVPFWVLNHKNYEAGLSTVQSWMSTALGFPVIIAPAAAPVEQEFPWIGHQEDLKRLDLRSGQQAVYWENFCPYRYEGTGSDYPWPLEAPQIAPHYERGVRVLTPSGLDCLVAGAPVDLTAKLVKANVSWEEWQNMPVDSRDHVLDFMGGLA